MGVSVEEPGSGTEQGKVQGEIHHLLSVREEETVQVESVGFSESQGHLIVDGWRGVRSRYSGWVEGSGVTL